MRRNIHRTKKSFKRFYVAEALCGFVMAAGCAHARFEMPNPHSNQVVVQEFIHFLLRHLLPV
jgi:hypothetical protein